MKSFILLIFIAFVSLSCVHESLYTAVDQTIVDSQCDPNNVYFVNDILPIIQSNCNTAGCHGNGSAQDGVSLINYAGIMEEVNPGNATNSKLYKVITDLDNNDVMPPTPRPRLTTTQILLIRNWINQGAKNNECSDCNTSNITFSQTVFPIIQNQCSGCHNGTSPQGGISLINYNQIKTISSNGSLLGTINHSNGFIPMPYNQPKINQCNIEKITIWVNAGALNN